MKFDEMNKTLQAEIAAILQMIQEQNQVSLEGSELESEGFLNEIFKMDTIQLPVTSNIGK